MDANAVVSRLGAGISTAIRRGGLIAALLAPVLANAATTSASPLDIGFHRLYELNFTAAQQEFTQFERERPGDPLGPASEAAGYIFSEFNRLGILQTRFFTDDSAFRSRPKLKPDAAVRQQFRNALERADELARKRLEINPKSCDALFAVTLAAGLRADYTSLVENRNLAALALTREAMASAQKLLAVCPNCYDAYVATGLSQYLVGSLSPPLRWIVRLGGYPADKKRGIEQLRLAAQHGRYLAPFARILLAVADLREKKPEEAQRVLEQLRDEFPSNPLFSRELARLERH